LIQPTVRTYYPRYSKDKSISTRASSIWRINKKKKDLHTCTHWTLSNVRKRFFVDLFDFHNRWI